MQNYYYKVVIEPQEEGGFTAYIPKLTGCVTEGETYNETLKNMQEALLLYLETSKERKHKIIKDNIHITEMCVSLWLKIYHR